MITDPRSGAGLSPAARGVLVLVAAVLLGLMLLARQQPAHIGTARIDANRPVPVTPPPTSATTTSTTTTSPGSVPATTTTTAPADTTTSTSTSSTTTSTTTPGVHPASGVKVAVLNGAGGVAKAASTTTAKIKVNGYSTLNPGNATARSGTVVYYARDYTSDALAVATLLNLPSAAVQPLPKPPPAGVNSSANVVVILGANTPAAP